MQSYNQVPQGIFNDRLLPDINPQNYDKKISATVKKPKAKQMSNFN